MKALKVQKTACPYCGIGTDSEAVMMLEGSEQVSCAGFTCVRKPEQHNQPINLKEVMKWKRHPLSWRKMYHEL